MIRPRFVRMVAGRHLRDLFRERRTLLGLVLVPVLVVLLFSFQRDELTDELSSQQAGSHEIAVQGSANWPALVTRMRQQDLRVKEVEDAATIVGDKRKGIGLIIPPNAAADVAAGRQPSLVIVTGNPSLRTQFARARLSSVIDGFSDVIVAERLRDRGLSPSITEPFEVAEKDVTTPRERAGNLLGEILPFMLLGQVVGLMSGVATNVTVGEKERRTVEALLASPLTRREIVAAGWFVTLAVGLLAGSITLAATIASIIPSALGTSALPVAGIASAAVGMASAAVFLSAVQVTIGFFARTTQQAGVFMTPLIFIAFVPLFFFATKAGGSIGLPLYAAPGLGPALLIRFGIAETARDGAVLVTLISSLAYAGVGIMLADRLLHSERALLRAGG